MSEQEKSKSQPITTYSYLTRRQVLKALEPISPGRVHTRDGMAYVEGHDIKASLIRWLGFGRWSWIVREQVVEHRQQTLTKAGKDAWYVIVRTLGDLTICAPDGTVLATYTGSHCGDSTHPVLGEAMGNAVTNSDTYALKRAAICAMGDLGGLGLYDRGSTKALVGGTFVLPTEDDESVPDPPPDPDVLEESLHRGMPDRDSIETNGNLTPPPVVAVENGHDVPLPVEPDPVLVDEQAELDRLAQAIADRARTLTGNVLPGIAKLRVEAGRNAVLKRLVTVGDEVFALDQVLDQVMKAGTTR
jgi:hypothetical protein